MQFKIYSDSVTDVPYITCDICSGRIGDFQNDLASGAKGNGQTPGDVTIHHQKCALPQPATVNMSIGDFIALFLVKNRIGTLANFGGAAGTNRVMIDLPANKGFSL